MLIAFQHTPQIIAFLLVDTFAIIPPESGNSFASLGYKNLYALLVFAQSIANKPAFSTNRPEKFLDISTNFYTYRNAPISSKVVLKNNGIRVKFAFVYKRSLSLVVLFKRRM